MATIELQGVTKRYPDGTEAVRGIDLEVADGEFLILVGPSGCGKTTALRMIAGLESITAGELRIDGERVNERAPKDRDIAMVFQSYALYPHMTVRDNMGFALRLAKTPKAEIAARVEQAAGVLDLTGHLDRKPGQLSGGQRQRVAMGRAIVRQPKAFLMDEPLSNLDAKLRVQMRAELARLQHRLGTTTVYVTHDQVEAMTLGDRVAVMKDGVIQQLDTPGELYEHPANLFVAGFIGAQGMNLIDARVHDGTLLLPFGEVALDGEVPDGEVIAGIRPERFTVARDAAAGGPRLRVVPDLVESLGSDLNVHFDVGGRALVARLDVDSRARAGEPLELLLDAGRIQLFNPDDGRNLAAASQLTAV
jgi:multiple sugar transport system ATP-binding protein